MIVVRVALLIPYLALARARNRRYWRKFDG